MVEHIVNAWGRDARGSCLSSAYVWTSSSVFLPILSLAGSLDSQKDRVITFVMFLCNVDISLDLTLADNKIIQRSTYGWYISVILWFFSESPHFKWVQNIASLYNSGSSDTACRKTIKSALLWWRELHNRILFYKVFQYLCWMLSLVSIGKLTSACPQNKLWAVN